MIEVKAKRTEYTKTFHTGRNKRMLFCSPHPIHRKENSEFTEIDLLPKETEGGFVLETPFYKFELTKYPFRIVFNDKWIRTMDIPATDFIHVSSGLIEITGFFKNIDLLIKFTSKSVNCLLRLNEPGKYEFNWKKDNGDIQAIENYEIPVTVKMAEYFSGSNPIYFNGHLLYPQIFIPDNAVVKFIKYSKSDFFEDIPTMEIYYEY